MKSFIENDAGKIAEKLYQAGRTAELSCGDKIVLTVC